MVRKLRHTEIGDIPVDWKLQTFDETLRVLSNNTLSRENLNNRSGAVRNIHYGDILTKFPEVLDCNEEEIPYVNDLSLLSSSTQLLQEGDIVIADTAEDETVGKVTEVQNLGDSKLVAGLHTIPCRVKKGDFAPGWLGYYMNSNLFHNQILSYITGIKVSSISKGAISETLILVPPFDEQEKIVQSLNEVQLLMTAETKVVNKMKFVKNGCLSKMFPKNDATVPEMRLPGFTDTWEQRKLDDVAEFSKGSGYSKGDLIESGTPIVLYGRLYTNYETIISDVDTFVEAKDGSVYSKGGEVIVPASGETAEDIARAASVDKSGILLGGDLNVVMPNEDINSAFLAISISNGNSQRELARKAQGKSVVHIHNEEIRNLVVPFPTKTEQNKIENYFADLDHLITLHQRKCDKYLSIKKGMTSDLLTGKIRLV